MKYLYVVHLMVNRKELKARFVIAKNHIFLKGFQTYKTIKHKIAK